MEISHRDLLKKILGESEELATIAAVIDAGSGMVSVYCAKKIADAISSLDDSLRRIHGLSDEKKFACSRDFSGKKTPQ